MQLRSGTARLHLAPPRPRRHARAPRRRQYVGQSAREKRGRRGRGNPLRQRKRLGSRNDRDERVHAGADGAFVETGADRGVIGSANGERAGGASHACRRPCPVGRDDFARGDPAQVRRSHPRRRVACGHEHRGRRSARARDLRRRCPDRAVRHAGVRAGSRLRAENPARAEGFYDRDGPAEARDVFLRRHGRGVLRADDFAGPARGELFAGKGGVGTASDRSHGSYRPYTTCAGRTPPRGRAERRLSSDPLYGLQSQSPRLFSRQQSPRDFTTRPGDPRPYPAHETPSPARPRHRRICRRVSRILRAQRAARQRTEDDARPGAARYSRSRVRPHDCRPLRPGGRDRARSLHPHDRCDRARGSARWLSRAFGRRSFRIRILGPGAGETTAGRRAENVRGRDRVRDRCSVGNRKDLRGRSVKTRRSGRRSRYRSGRDDARRKTQA